MPGTAPRNALSDLDYTGECERILRPVIALVVKLRSLTITAEQITISSFHLPRQLRQQFLQPKIDVPVAHHSL